MILKPASHPILSNEQLLVQNIKNETKALNKDNISRTDAYFQFYKQHPEIHWSFLASMVSRNAGWNMCDLEGSWLPQLLSKEVRVRLFYTYEKANWLIFRDAYPQLLLYHYSTKVDSAMFHLLNEFQVSAFMEREWNHFWSYRDYKRLLISLIVNEQHVIHKPVITHPHVQSNVFRTFTFFFQDLLHFSSILLPTCEGNLYGASVNGFKNVHKRIDLGKRIASILFNEQLYPAFYKFASKSVHTGSRYDYESYFMKGKTRETPILRAVYPIIEPGTHGIMDHEDWSVRTKIRKSWYENPIHYHPILLNDWFFRKQSQIQRMALFKQIIE
ncbi:DUF2515 family protein [Bacillus tuaregi]|uniref:DUF2515 family protein n=1 Tax=Bacillus tuaregi TaxID=1816695 RepID=UPI0008F8FD44|nr:DUF2515 family protein [Bacillus tuaregi]